MNAESSDWKRYIPMSDELSSIYEELDISANTREYPADWKEGMEAYYPVNDEKNQALYQQYAALAENEDHVIFGGRLAEYKYYDMDKVIASALKRTAECMGE